jgi:hypothetical protein
MPARFIRSKVLSGTPSQLVANSVPVRDVEYGAWTELPGSTGLVHNMWQNIKVSQLKKGAYKDS